MNDHLRIPWRWVWCVLGVLVAGCSGAGATGSPVVSAYPTLIGYTLLPPTPQSPLRLVRTPLLASGTPGLRGLLPISVGPPDCFEATTGALRCLGRIYNPLVYAVEGVMVRVTLLDANGGALDSQDVPMARLRLYPDDESPYGALFASIPAAYSGASVELLRAEQAQSGAQIRLTVTYDGATLTVANPTARDATTIHAVVTLYGSADRVIGYRVLESEGPLRPGVSAAFPFTVAALDDARPARVHAAGEGIVLSAPLTPTR